MHAHEAFAVVPPLPGDAAGDVNVPGISRDGELECVACEGCVEVVRVSSGVVRVVVGGSGVWSRWLLDGLVAAAAAGVVAKIDAEEMDHLQQWQQQLQLQLQWQWQWQWQLQFHDLVVVIVLSIVFSHCCCCRSGISSRCRHTSSSSSRNDEGHGHVDDENENPLKATKE